MLKNPSAVVEIAGEDSINYDGHAPKGHKSWGNSQTTAFGGSGRREGQVDGVLDANEYVNWLQNSQCHDLTTPSCKLEFVGSVGLRMSNGCERRGAGSRALRRNQLRVRFGP